MNLVFHSKNVWPHITEIVSGAGRTHAAIAYIGEDAPDRLPLGDGDVLLVNAGDHNVSSRATNPYALERFIKLGVEVHSSDHLHAKVIVTDAHAIIGSANASASSARSSEAIVVTDCKETRKEVEEFVLQEIKNSGMEITQEKLADLKRIFDEGNPRHGITGVNTPEPITTGFPWPLGTVHLVERADGNLSDDESSAILTGSTRPTGFTLDVMQLDQVDHAFESGDIIIFCDNKYVQPPIKVDSKVIYVDGNKSRMGQVVQQKTMRRQGLTRTTVARRFDSKQERFSDLMDSLDNASGRLKLEGDRRDALIRIWFPDFKEATAPVV